MSVIRYIGNYDILADGKLLLEILSQLRNYGVGRMVYKGEWLRRWPEQPSYCIVKKVEPNMDRWLWKGSVYGDFVYRGKRIGLFHFDKDLHMADWKLVHKHEEEQFVKCKTPFETRKLAKKLPLPPLMRLMRELEAKEDGVAVDSIELSINNRPLFDEEHLFLKKHTQLVDEMNPSINEDIYAQDKSVYLDLYGQQLPHKVEDWSTERVE